jgi:FkbM family methyltransferase
MLKTKWYQLVRTLKRLRYHRHGEPYRIGGQTFRYVPGTRPIRTRYAASRNPVNRHDALQVLWLWDHLSEGDVAIDVGAHYGIYSVLMAAKCGPTGRVIAFEPDPWARITLQNNLRLNPSLKAPTVESSACSNQEGQGILFSRHGDARSALVARLNHSEEFPVSLVALDSYLAENKLSPRCVKIDTEGAEIRILQGAPKLLDSDAQMICELHPFAWSDFGNTFAQLQEIVTAAGRWMRYLDQDCPVHKPEYGTVVLERKSCRVAL